MSVSFLERPILNSPYEYSSRHWEIVDGLPTDRIAGARRRSEYISPVPKPKKRRQSKEQSSLELGQDGGFATDQQRYDPTPIINEIRGLVGAWRRSLLLSATIPPPRSWSMMTSPASTATGVTAA
jgi:type III restriction enzyme